MKVVGAMGGLMIGCVTEEPGVVVAGCEAELGVDDAEIVLRTDDETDATDEGIPLEADALEAGALDALAENVDEICEAELVACDTELAVEDPEDTTVDDTTPLRVLLVAARTTGRRGSKRSLIVASNEETMRRLAWGTLACFLYAA